MNQIWTPDEFNEWFHRYEKESKEASRPFPETKQVLESAKRSMKDVTSS